VQNEEEAGGHANEDAYEQIGRHDGNDRYDERNELVSALLPFLFEQLGIGEFETGDDENRGQTGEWYLV
jgi:hypothetical protein